MNPYGATLPGRLSGVGGDETHPIAGMWPGVRRPVVPRMLPTAVVLGSHTPKHSWDWVRALPACSRARRQPSYAK